MSEIDVSRQAHLHTRESAFWAPFYQSLGTGFFITAAAWTLMILNRVPGAWKIALVILVLVSAVTWLGLQWRNIWLTLLEDATGLDLNHDGQIGSQTDAEEAVIPVRIDIRHYDEAGNLKEVSRARFQNMAKMVRIADAIVNRDKPFSMRVMIDEEQILKNREEFKVIAREMELRGMAFIRDPKNINLGWEITRAGKAVFRDLLSSTTPLPE